MRVIALGATRGMGRALARALATRGDALCLLGRDPDELRASAADLAVRGAAGAVPTIPCDLADPATFGPALDAAFAALAEHPAGDDPAWAVVLTGADFATQDTLEADPERALRLLQVNFAHSIHFLEHARRRLLERGGGVLVAFSSVAGDRGRKPVALYGATKAGLSHYLESLDHRHRRDGLAVVCVKPGFVHTDMTRGLPSPPFAGTPEGVAQRVLGAIDRRAPLVYAPAPWRAVMAVIRRLPRAVMRRVSF